MIEPEKSLWELMEMEAVERYFIDREGFRAEGPGVIITSGIWRAPDCKSTEFYTVWFGQGIGHWNFTNLKCARGKVKEILATAKVSIEVRVEKRGEEKGAER